MTIINTPPTERNWREQLDERELKELYFADEYASRFRHGTDGHGRLMLITKLGHLLDHQAAALADLRRRLDEATKEAR